MQLVTMLAILNTASSTAGVSRVPEVLAPAGGGDHPQPERPALLEGVIWRSGGPNPPNELTRTMTMTKTIHPAIIITILLAAYSLVGWIEVLP